MTTRLYKCKEKSGERYLLRPCSLVYAWKRLSVVLSGHQLSFQTARSVLSSQHFTGFPSEVPGADGAGTE
ncbi:hypothetical protein CHARACLAT_012087 [Characodon lateralis]|uniref:Uncharacterized protein n=1 Tax=Characodon lateralis TaxID=208331 RepID=A0ABU7DJT4_9TELE|nr:hypothetical protein [Characodon lateralis]